MKILLSFAADPMTETVPVGESMGEAEVSAWMQEHVVRIAERAFWDSFVENLLVRTRRVTLRGSSEVSVYIHLCSEPAVIPQMQILIVHT